MFFVSVSKLATMHTNLQLIFFVTESTVLSVLS